MDSCLVAYSGKFSAIAFYKRIHCSYPVMVWPDPRNSYYIPSFDPTKYRALLDICFRRWCSRLSTLYMRPLTFWLLVLPPFYVAGFNPVQNVFLLHRPSNFSDFRYLSVSARMRPNFLTFWCKSFKSFQNNLLSNFQIFWELFCVRHSLELHFWKRTQLNCIPNNTHWRKLV